MFYRPYPSTQEEKQKVLEQARKTIQFLAQSGCILRSKRFHKYVVTTEGRFEWVTDNIQAKLIADLMFQVRWSMPSRSSVPRDELSMADQFNIIADQCDAEVLRLENLHGVDVPKKEKTFAVRKGENFEDNLYEFFSRKCKGPFLKDLHRPFYLWNVLESFTTFVRAKRTLTHDTGHKAFEKFLASLKENYLLKGYPHDILAHDAEAVRNEEKPYAILVRKSYCSTAIIQSKDDVLLEGNDFKLLELKAA